jgi:TPP-dependent pyruvate/acetoin dehydrogenase alpha subunit
MISLYKLVVRGRELEQQLTKLPGYHPAVGEEAVIVGSFFGLGKADYCVPHYRGALLAAHIRGADLRRLVAGIFGKATSYSRGRVRGDVCLPWEFGTLGLFSGVLGNSLNIAAGLALSEKVKQGKGAVVASFGEGSSNLGAFHESVNMAACLSLPIVYVCQNNQFAMSTRSDYSLKCNSVADRAPGYGIPGQRIDGNDVLAVHAAVQAALVRARAGDGPTLIEALTYRISGHFSADDNAYQPAAERETWLKKDPLDRIRETIRAQGLQSVDEQTAFEQDARAEIAAAIEQAQNDPDPDLDVLGAGDAFCETGHTMESAQ